MAGPSIVTVGRSTTPWTLVAADIEEGHIWILDNAPSGYFQTWVDTGDAAPTGVPSIELRVRVIGNHIPIASQPGRRIDVYMYCTGTEDGKVRVDE